MRARFGPVVNFSPLEGGRTTDGIELLSQSNGTGRAMNETLKAELGRHAWFLFHTVMAHHAERPTAEERADLRLWVDSFTKLYPCHSCASHFAELLLRYPLQSSSRLSAAQWGCAMHNQVNVHLGKEEYDCSKILEDYDCGCGNAT